MLQIGIDAPLEVMLQIQLQEDYVAASIVTLRENERWLVRK